MALPYSTVFLNRQGVTDQVSYTVPAGKRAVLVCVDIFIGVSGGGGEVFIRDDTSGAAIWFHLAEGIVQESQQWTGREVFNEGSRLQVTTSTPAMPIDVRASGYLLSA